MIETVLGFPRFKSAVGAKPKGCGGAASRAHRCAVSHWSRGGLRA